MIDVSNTVLREYQIRKTKKQKTRFIEYVSQFSKENGYDCRVEKGMFGVRNLVVGDPNKAKVFYTAHYDTCPVLPFPNFITPKNIFFYLFYQILIVAVLLIGLCAAGFLLGMGAGIVLELLSLADSEAALDVTSHAITFLLYVVLFWFLLAGPANKHTANDNTSGVITLLEILQALPAERRGEVCVVFFDLEEMGLFGSSSFSSKHKKILSNKLLINFDCVSDGKKMLFAVRKKAKPYLPVLTECFPDREDVTAEICKKGVFYPSDQMQFPCGVGVAALKYSKLLRTEYMDRIHTPRDVIFREENIAYLTAGALKLAERL